MARVIISARDLAFAYPQAPDQTIFQGVSFGVHANEFVALVGPSGVGKSTLLRLIAGLIPPTAGKVEVERLERPGSRDFGFVFQEPRLMPWRRVQANVEYGLEGVERGPDTRRRRAAEMLAMVGLADKAKRWPHQLSGGQRQRVSLARALAVKPAILLMDEPFSALDPVTRATMQDELLAIRDQSPTAVVFVTHDMAEAAYLADRIIVLGGTPAGITREAQVTAPHPRPRGQAEELIGDGVVDLFQDPKLKRGNQ